MLKDIIRRERTRLGWDQAELGRQLRVGQQTVSGWERGASRPRRHHVGQLAQLFGRDVTELLVEAGYVAPVADRPEEAVPVVRPRLATLRFRDLSPDRFEQFTADLIMLLFDGSQASRFGGQGHKQDGIDVIATDKNGQTIVVQCKRQERFGPAQVKAAVEAASKTPADKYYLFLTRVTSPAARQEIRRYADWTLWDVDDLSRVIRYQLPPDAAVRLVDAYFPGAREPFLGVSAPGPWLTTAEFFQPFTGGQLFSHDWDLVGRESELAQITSWALEATSAVGLLIGRGGTGKTRLLKAVAQELAQARRVPVRFLAASLDVAADHFELLRGIGPLLVIVDDAHDRTDNAALLAGIRRVRPDATILFSLRPYGQTPLLAGLRPVGLDHAEPATWTLDDLRRSDAERLATQVLAAGTDPGIARRIAALTTDCPLLTVVGAGLVRRGALNPSRFEADDTLRREVLLGFRDALIGTSTGTDAKLRRDVLDAVAVLQPVRLGEPDFADALTNLTGAAFDRVMPHLRSLAEGGVLLRRGSSLRVVPDLLGDVVLVEAAMDRASGTDTGFVNRARQATAGGRALQNVFVNASRIDWQVGQAVGKNSSLVEPLWSSLQQEFASSAVHGRARLLRLLQRVAVFQPRQTLALVRWAIAHPTEAVEDTYPLLLTLAEPTDDTVLRELPPLLRLVGLHLDHLPEAADLLWRLAQSDHRPLNPHPDHPMRVLKDLAKYEIGKPLPYGHSMVDAVTRWLTRPLGDSVYTPLDVLEPLVETEGFEQQSDGLTVSFTPRMVNPNSVGGLRERVVKLALSELGAEDPWRAVQAVRLLGSALHYPRGLFGRTTSEAERAPWTPLFVRTLEQIAATVTDAEFDPAVAVALRGALSWHTSKHATPALQVAATTALERLPDSDIHQLADALHGDWWSRAEDLDSEESQRQLFARFHDIATRISAERSDQEVADLLASRLSTERRAFGPDKGNPSLFVWSLLDTLPSIATAICQTVEGNLDSPLRELVPVAIGHLASAGESEAIQWSRRLMASNSTDVARYVSSAFGQSGYGRRQLLPGEFELFQDLVSHPDEGVRCAALRAVRLLAAVDRHAAVALVMQARFVDSRPVAEEVCGAFGRHGFLTWQDLAKDQQDALLAQLRDCPSIDDYYIMSFLSHVSASDPDTVVNLLTSRIERSGASDPRVYDPLPHEWHQPLQVRTNPQFERVLNDTIDWLAAQVDDWYVARLGAEVFRAVAQEYDQQIIDLLGRTIDTQSVARIKAVGAILAEVPRTFVWNQVEFVRLALNAAARVGEDCVQAIGTGLHSAVVSGSRFGTPGQPFPQDVEQRDKSMAIADKLPPGSLEERFYRSLAQAAQTHIAREISRDEARLDGRDW